MVARRKLNRDEHDAGDGGAHPVPGTAPHHQVHQAPQDHQAPPPSASSSPYRGVGGPQDPGMIQTKMKDFFSRKKEEEIEPEEEEEVRKEEERREDEEEGRKVRKRDEKRGGRRVRKDDTSSSQQTSSPRIKRLREVPGHRKNKVNGRPGMPKGSRDIRGFFHKFKDQTEGMEGGRVKSNINTNMGAISDKFTHNPRKGNNLTGGELTGGRRGGGEDAPI